MTDPQDRSMYDPTAHHTNGNGHHRNGDAPHARPATLLDRLPPQNLEAEAGVIGSVLLDNSVMHEVAPIVRPEDFYLDRHQTLYREILALYDLGKPFDVTILSDAMGDRYRAFGGDDALAEIVNGVAHTAHARYYALIVRQKAIGRALIEGAGETLRECYSNDFTAEQLLEAAEKRTFAIAEAEATGDTVPAADVVALAMERVEVRRRGEVTGIGTGYPDLDDMTDGLQPGNLILVAARPGAGKTSLGLNIADHVSTYRGGLMTLFVSLEMNRVELGEKLISSRSRVDSYRLKNPGTLTAHDWHEISKAGAALGEARMFVDDTPMRTVTQVAANARRLRSRHGLGLVLVDYIQLIDGQRLKGESRQEEVARVSRRLKALARELQVPVVVMAQLNRESERRDDRRPRLADLRESGQLEADADIVLLIHRPESYDPNDRPGEADLIVAKNRNGATGTVRMTFLKHCTRFESKAPYIPPADEPAF